MVRGQVAFILGVTVILIGILPAQDSVRVREIYVPYAELRARTGGDPNGTIMTLEEYRKLLLDALRASRKKLPVELPPIESAVVSSVTKGKVETEAVRLESRIRIQVTSDGWVRCDLGTPIETLGSVTVDGGPGWIVIEETAEPVREGKNRKNTGQTGTAEKAIAQGRAFLLLRGQGEHEAVLNYSLPVTERKDRFTIEGPLVPAAASSVEVDVPGVVEATASPPFLETVSTEDRSRLLLSAGGSNHFQVSWRRKRAATETESLLGVSHWVTYTLDRTGSVLHWEALVTIARRKTGVLTFTEPAGTIVVRVDGPLVHGWERVAEGLRVTLNEETIGVVRVVLSGIVNAAQDRAIFAAPALSGAFANTGFLGFTAPRDARLRVGAVTAVTEVAAKEAAFPPAGSPPTRRVPTWARSFAFASSEARVEVELVALKNRFESRSTLGLHVTEDGATLDARVQLAALEGHLWRFEISLPEPWHLLDLKEAPAGANSPPAHGLRHELMGPRGARVLRLELERPLGPAAPVEIAASFELEGFGPNRAWTEKSLDLFLPAVFGAERSRTDIGVLLPESMDAILEDSPLWRSLAEDESAVMGFQSASAALSSRETAPRLALKLVHRPARGELRVVSHVLALEDHLRVRADLRLAIVDRPVEEISFAVPASASATVVILGQGIKEITVDPATGRRIARFSTPWLGTRQFRVELEAPHSPNTEALIPDVQVLAPSGDARLGSERFVVLQSRGAVEIKTAPGPGLATADVDEIPSFAEPWAGGRVISAYRFRPDGDAGTLRTTVHERAPVLRSLAREMNLTTVLGADGVVRTRTDLLLAYSRQTHLAVRLPDGSRCLSVTVNGETTQSVRPGARGEEIFIPLPPMSYAQVGIVSESPDSSATPSHAAMFDPFGSLSLTAPLLPDMPVGQTRWTVYYPEGYRFAVTTEAMRSSASELSAAGLFAETFVCPMLAGNWPKISFLEPASPGATATTSVQTLEASDPVITIPEPQAPTGQLQAREFYQQVENRIAGPSFPLWPEGHRIQAEKMGGNAQLTLEYRSLRFERFAQRGVFLAVLVAGWGLTLGRGARVAARSALWSLLVLGALPFAFGWRSPLLLVPLCEGLVALLLCLALAAPGRWLLRGRQATTIALVLVIAGAGRSLSAAPGDEVLIPYNPSLPGLVNARDDKVFVPRETFRRLWKLAHPDAPIVEPEPAADLLLGNAEYTLTVEGDAYRLAFKIAVRTFNDRWAAAPLLIEGRILRLLVDGVEAGVAQARTVQSTDSIPFVELKGAGNHWIEGEVTSPVESLQGLFRASGRLWRGPSASLQLRLPEGAKLQSPATAVVLVKDGARTATIDLGATDKFALEWNFPKIEGQSGSQSESRSLSILGLTAEGYSVDRIERIRVTGRPASAIEYQLLGTWQITEVSGAGVSEWSVARDDANPPGLRLRITFAQPVSQAEVNIHGRARLSASGPLSSLALIGAARQESFVGLLQSDLRRFAQQVLGGMRRAGREELAAAFTIPPGPSFERLYHAHGAGEGEVIAIELVPSEIDVTTDIVAFLDDRRAALSVRSRYSVKGPGPQRHEVPLPDGWIVRSVQSASLRSWEVLDSPRRLVIELVGRAEGGTELTWSAESVFDQIPIPIEMPRVRISPLTGAILRETQRWSLAAIDELELSVADVGQFIPESLEAAQQWVDLPRRASYRLALRSPRGEPQGQDSGLQVTVTRRQSLLGAIVVGIARIAEDFIHVSARVHFQVRLGGRDSFRLQLPPSALLGGVETRNERSRDVRRAAEGIEIEVVLQSPVSGEHSIDVAYQVPRLAGTPPTILPIKVFDGSARLGEVDQYVAVLQTGAALASTSDASRLVALEAESLPFLPAGVAPESLRPIFRATQLDWSLRLEEKLIEVTRSGAVVELAELTTVVGGDGTTRTRAVYTVRNKELQFLLIDMPGASTLWGVTLNGSPVAVGQSAVSGTGAAQKLRVPLEYVGSASLSLEVALQYEEPALALPSLRGSAELAAPRVIDTQVVETVWNLIFPHGYELHRSGGNLREVASSVLYAKRTESLLTQLDKVSKAAQESDSVRVREQATRELARVEQALGDNLAELSANNRSPDEAAQAKQIGRADLEAQWASNDVMIEKARTAQEGLRQSRAEREKTQGQKTVPSKQEQAFLDATNHLRQEWRFNSPVVTAPGTTAPGTTEYVGLSLEGLLEPAFTRSSQAGLGGAPPPAQGEADVALPADSPGLKPLPDLAGAGLVPGLEAPLPRDSGVRFTFVNQGGDARVAFTFTREDLAPRLAVALAAIVLSAVAIALGAWRRKSQKSG